MLRLRTWLLSVLAAAAVPTGAACAPALDFDALTRGNGSKDASDDRTVDAQGDAPDDRGSALDADSDSASPTDAGIDAPADAPPSTDAAEEYAADPCANVDAANNGLYCGRSTQAGFSDGDPLYVYTCVNGMVSNVVSCPNGCFIAPAGYEDECDQCGGRPDGVYCGSQFSYLSPSDRLLIVCSAGHVPDGGLTPCSTSCVLDGGAHCGP
ncbi:MAG TPA: hypothetical protein VMI75_34205 [Polyangiaceae bacterium]|nr:hypothetical protein [Polyangiaceae bacterium]